MTRIRVICRDSSHEAHSRIVGTFINEGAGWVSAADASGTSEWLNGNIPIRDDEGPSPDASAIRRSYNLKCQRCGVTVTARPETLDAYLDRGAVAGVSELTLATLAALLSK